MTSNKSNQKNKSHKSDQLTGTVNKPDKESSRKSSEATKDASKKKSLISRCCGCMKYVVLILIVPPFLNYAALHQEQRFLLASETLYDVGNGQKLAFKCTGEGKPTVLLEAPTGMSSDVWDMIIPKLSKITKVCSYDRAGLGFSDRPYQNMSKEVSENDDSLKHERWKAFTVESMVDDVFELISYRSQQVDKPFIYVGSQLGAMVARFYTQIYETDVSDLLLIDPLVENIFEENAGVWADYWFYHIIPSYQTLQLAAATGLTRLALMTSLMTPPLADTDMPDTTLMKLKHLLCHPRHLSTVVDEHHFINESMSQMQTVFMMKAFPKNVSVTVITGNYHDEQLPSHLNQAWSKSQQHLLTRIHPGSSHIVVNGADTNMIYKKPDAVVEPIKRLILNRRRTMKTEKSS